jgi:hypothetical protein
MTTLLMVRKDDRAAITYKAGNPAHVRAIKRSARRLRLPVATLIEKSLNRYLADHGLSPLPPRTAVR